MNVIVMIAVTFVIVIPLIIVQNVLEIIASIAHVYGQRYI